MTTPSDTFQKTPDFTKPECVEEELAAIQKASQAQEILPETEREVLLRRLQTLKDWVKGRIVWAALPAPYIDDMREALYRTFRNHQKVTRYFTQFSDLEEALTRVPVAS